MIQQKHFKIIKQCQLLYDKNLLDKQLLVIYKEKETALIKSIKIIFKKENFLHLTGIVYEGEDNSRARHFYDLLSTERLDFNKCHYKQDGTTQLKLDVLTQIMNIDSTARMIGNYNGNKINLIADKIIGSIYSCMALCNDESGDFFFPRSALKEDIRSQVVTFNQIRAIYVRDYISEEKGNIVIGDYILRGHAKNYSEAELPDYLKHLIEQ